MEDHNGELHVETDSARGGSTPHIVRWVLGISLVAAIVLLSIIWMTGALTHDDRGDNPTAMERIESQPTTGPVAGAGAVPDGDTPATGAAEPNRVAN